MKKPIGVDLGTTYCATSVVRDGGPEILPNREGGSLTPSVVLFQGGADALVGDMAKRSAAAMPDDCVQFVKREMGNSTWCHVDSAGTERRAEQVSAIILGRLMQDAALALGYECTDAVVTVPAYFDDARRTATKQAAQIAGLNVLRLINEPTAAAVAYGFAQREGGTFFVYDLGGGTFDVTILRAAGGDFEVVATDGDRNLGGYDFDNELMKHVAAAVVAQGKPDPLDDPVLAAELRERCELAKRTLTTTPQATVFVGAGAKVTVTLAEFEKLTADLLERTEIITEGVLDDAKLSWADIDHVLLVGGSTRMPMVRALVKRLSGKEPEARINPDEAVALGAAIVADQESATPEIATPVTIRDVTSQALGTTILNESTGKLVNDIMIQRNSKIPCRVEETYYTVEANQQSILVDITEGDSDDPEYVAKLIEKHIPLPPGLPDGAPIRHIMRYDIDGLIHLELVDDTNRRNLGEVELDRPHNLDDSDVQTMRRAMRDLEIQ